MDRQQLNEIAFFGIGQPCQISPPAISPFYSEAYEKAYIEYHPEEANRLLDEMGLKTRNKAGIRLRPDGKPLHIRIEIASVFLSTPMFELIAKQWTDVGIKTQLKLEARQLFYTRKSALMHDVGVWGSADELIPVIDPRWFFPFSQESIQGIGYARWFLSNGKRGIVPPEEMMKCMELYQQIERIPDPTEQVRLFQQIIELNRQNLWVIGTIGRVPSLFVVKDTFRNVPEVAVSGWIFRTPGNTAPECYAIDQPTIENDEGINVQSDR
jgi:peptide/nickel transport system substrate-binding protein